jgi:hypothetical protein
MGSEMTGTTAVRQTAHPAGCCCPACSGLECLERPRFFAGQLLTESELNGEQAYVVAKNRLHNRYLHGPGVVCGLQLGCDPCEGWVTIAPGYAIDPCGNDIVVCQGQRLNVAELIARCRDTGPAPCDPVRPQNRGDCRGVEEHWCVTIRYEEREARASTVLRRATTTSCSCTPNSGCGCHSNGKTNGNGGCGCGCGGTNGTSRYATYGGSAAATVTAATRQASTTTTMGACEPTRIVEGFRLDVCEGPVGLCRTPTEVLQGSLLWEILECVRGLWEFGKRRVPKSSYQPLLGAVFAREATATPNELYETYSYTRQALYEYAGRQPRCNIAEKLDQIVLQTPPNEEDASYGRQAQVALQSLLAVVWEYVIDCVCQKLLPTCPPDPCDDRLTLACLTVLDGKIVGVCNYSCRTYAGSWPTFSRWLSLVPVLPLLNVLLEYVCCLDWFRSGAGGVTENRMMAAIEHVDPTYRRARLYESDFSQVHDLVAALGRVRDNLTAPNIPAVVEDPKGFAEILRSAFRDEEA